MSNRRYIISLLAVAACLIGCNESLEDTYSDYAGDGKIRYVAKCSDVYATPGWERLIVNWVNGTDATIDKIRIVWTCDERRDSVFLPNTTTSHVFDNLPNGTYRFDICAMDKFGNQSIQETTYGRPYTREHEVMRAFTRGVIKSFFVNNKMIFFTDQWNDNIVEIKLQYKNTQGETKYFTFDKGTDYNAFLTLDDVSMNPADTVYVLRRGKLEGCPDELVFDPYVISRHKNFSAGFVNAIERRYGYSTETKEQEDEFVRFVENAEELELDYNIETLEDVLYCSKLKRLVVGKNRYLQTRSTSFDNSKILNAPAKSYQVIAKASEPDILGLKVHYYGNKTSRIHYFDKEYPYMVYEGYPQLPADLEIINADALREYENGNKISCTPEDPYAILNNLVDDDSKTRWSTTSFSTMRTYNMQMELKEETEIRGIKVAQILYEAAEYEAPYFMPTLISIQTSRDGAVWENVTHFETNELGRGTGEVTLLPIAEGSRRVRYIKFSLRDGNDQGSFWMIRLGDIMLYK